MRCLRVKLSIVPAKAPAGYRFGHFLLDRHRGGLYGSAWRIRLAALPLRLLTLVVVRHGCLVTKDEICRVIWGDVAVTGDSIARAVSTIRSVLGDSRLDPWFLETITGLGYRVIVQVTEKTMPSTGSEQTRSDRPEFADSAALPFRRIGDLYQDFAAGLSESIAINLMRECPASQCAP